MIAFLFMANLAIEDIIKIIYILNEKSGGF